jgi:hypothetical protein
MQIGVSFGRMRVALDLGSDVNVGTVGAFIRAAGTKAARQIRRTANRAAAEATRRIERRAANLNKGPKK